LFSHLQQHLAGQKFYKEEVKIEVTIWLHVQVAESFDIGIQKIVSRLNKCLDKGGDYVLQNFFTLFSLNFFLICIFTFWMSYIHKLQHVD